MTCNKRVDALTIDDQIISVHKVVRKARRWLVYQLNQKIKRLAVIKIQSNQQRDMIVRRSFLHLEELEAMKRMDADNVSKYALCCVHKLSQILLDSRLVEVGGKSPH